MKTKEEEIASAIIRTITYSDIFDYPLTFREVLKFLISDTEVAGEVVRGNLEILVDDGRIYTDGVFYFLKRRRDIVETRKKRNKWSEKKLTIAKEVANKLRALPWVKTIAITGSLAMENCDNDDDIDLMVITMANRLWFTRLILYTMAPILGIKRRRPKEKEIKDKVCFNLFLEENSLQIQPENLFLAHEICQTIPIFNRDNTYEKFLWENRWVKKFLPNGVKISAKFKAQGSKLERKNFIFQSLSILISFFNQLAYKLQYQYMKPKITNEKISLHQAFFHPKNLEEKISASFEEKMKRIRILDKTGEWLI